MAGWLGDDVDHLRKPARKEKTRDEAQPRHGSEGWSAAGGNLTTATTTTTTTTIMTATTQRDLTCSVAGARARGGGGEVEIRKVRKGVDGSSCARLARLAHPARRRTSDAIRAIDQRKV
ncbi:hypothetical protein ANO11243_031680 [Dothideomycetidae sp. 11243]|nr:hypothetical protein ANO11243_031680 [fungal sp. No.11243]